MIHPMGERHSAQKSVSICGFSSFPPFLNAGFRTTTFFLGDDRAGGSDWFLSMRSHAPDVIPMSKFCILFTILLTIAAVGRTETTNSAPWNFKQEFLPALVQAVPGMLKSQAPSTGRFGSGV